MPMTVVTTAKGLALNAKIQAGGGGVGLKFTKVVADAGRADDLLNLEQAIDPRLTFVFEKKTAVQSHAMITLMLSNQPNPHANPPIPPLLSGFSMNQIPWYAEDPDEGEILYQVWRYEIDPGTGGGIPYVPPSAESVWTYNPRFTITISDAGVVTTTIDPNSLASRQSIWDAIESSDADIPSSGTRVHARFIKEVTGYTPFGMTAGPDGIDP